MSVRSLLLSCLLVTASCAAWADNNDEPPAAEPACSGPVSHAEILSEATAAERHQAMRLLPPDELARAQAVAAQLQVDCPYTRASWQLPAALLLEAQRIDPAHLPPAQREAWRSLVTDLAHQVHTLDLIGADLALPEAGDHLFDHGLPSSLITRAALAEHEDPVAQTLTLIRDNDRLVEAMTVDVQERIGHRTDVLYEVFGDTTMKQPTNRRHEALRRIAPYVQDAAARGRIDAMVRALDEHGQHGC